MEPSTKKAIEDCLKNYKRQWAHYKDLARQANEICEDNLRGAGIRAIHSYRAKDYESLKKKLYDMDPEICKGWKDGNSIRQDIFDLAGVRIALYYPKQKADVEQMIQEKFQLGATKDHDTVTAHERAGYIPIFTGYRAKHYRVSLREEDVAKAPTLNSEDIIEIQVVTVLQHAWAEVHHDVLYKQLHGDPSQGECRALDGLSGLVQLGELLLDSFQDTHVDRIKFENNKFKDEYELGAFLSKTLSQNAPEDPLLMGRVGILFKFLNLVRKDTPTDLVTMLEELRKAKKSLRDVAIEASEEYAYREQNATIAIMYHALSIDSAFSRLDSVDFDKKHMAKVMASTIVTLEELFSPFFVWEKKLLGDDRQQLALPKAALLWFIGSVEAIEIMSGDPPRNDEASKKLQSLWAWFDKHSDPAVKFVFGVSKMGLHRDFPTEVARISMLFPFFENHSAPARI
ncbi:hypothetical protein SLS58_001645 [Diplodia intermedia]|uniref:RelA/SpoT domain-containing protein n=1 Tax=Diplodia intermedia TaxID=856260 RepID=A0ABR3U1T6_9PEZI